MAEINSNMAYYPPSPSAQKKKTIGLAAAGDGERRQRGDEEPREAVAMVGVHAHSLVQNGMEVGAGVCAGSSCEVASADALAQPERMATNRTAIRQARRSRAFMAWVRIGGSCVGAQSVPAPAARA